MNWSKEADFKAQLQKLWERGDILAELWAEGTKFPLRLTFKRPSSTEIGEEFDKVRAWISELKSLKNCRIATREFNHRLLGRNSIPHEIWIDTIDDALSWIHRKKDYLMFESLVKTTRDREPVLLNFLRKAPFRVLEHAENWNTLLAIVAWMKDHPRPGIYPREVVIPGMDSKFIEENASIISALLDMTLPPEAIDKSMNGVKKFAARFGFSEERPLIRFRLLDQRYNCFPGTGDQDISLDWETFAQAEFGIKRVFITENKTNFLAFPTIPESMIIFGAGYGFEHLGAASSLFHCQIYYWGDIDTHGFGALNNLRKYFPHVRSLMMDETTLLRYKHLKGCESEAHESDWLETLTNEEQYIFDGLRANTWGSQFRLEQEHIDWAFAKASIAAAIEEDAVGFRRDDIARLSNWDISNLLSPTQCEIRPFLAGRETPTYKAISSDDWLKKFREQQLRDQKMKLGNMLDLSEIHDHDVRFRATAEAIKSCVEVIYKPLLKTESSIDGQAVEIMSEADFLVLENNQYFIRNISPRQRIDSDTTNCISSMMQIRLFGWLMRKMNMTPSRLEIVNGRNEILPIIPADAAVFRVLYKAMLAKYSSHESYSPVGWSKCSKCGYETRCWDKAIVENDISLLPGIDQELAQNFHKEGVRNIDSLLASFDESSLSVQSRRVGGRAVRIGNRAREILSQARAYQTQNPIWLTTPALPESSNYVILDLEGIPANLDRPEIIFLFGMQAFGSDSGSYISAEGGYDQQSQMEAWKTFLNNARQMFERYGDAVRFVHWGHYEATMLKKYVERYGDHDGTASQVVSNLFDLLPTFQTAVAIPVPSYSLKVVEKYIGFQRTQKEFGGEWVIGKFFSTLECVDQEEKEKALGEIRLYNSEDLKATYEILRWLRTHSQK